MDINEQYVALQAKLKNAHDTLKTISGQIDHLQQTCPHTHMRESWIGDAECPDCGYQTHEWYCETSPTKTCDYYDPETQTYNGDICIHCGEPDERK